MTPAGDAVTRRRRLPWSQGLASFVILLGLGIFLYPPAASWFSQLEQSRVTETARHLLDEPPHDDTRYTDQQIDLARRYNQALDSGAVSEAHSRLPAAQGSTTADSLDYDDLLNLGGTGLIGRLQYQDLGIDLPVYHGTGDETLLRGVGHLEGTSLPVGGMGTRAVLTAHRGLPSATLFNDLDRAEIGDTITISVLDRVLSYRVVEFEVIEPDATEAIWPTPDRDLLTLITCTPLGINSHRILVTAERITPTPPQQATAASEDPHLPGFPWWAVTFGAAVLLLLGYVWSGWAASAPQRPGRLLDTTPSR